MYRNGADNAVMIAAKAEILKSTTTKTQTDKRAMAK